MTGEWGSCSVTCGKGLQQREVVCVYHLQNGSLIHTRDLYCQGGKPPPLQGCEGRLCLTVWEASEWSKVRHTYTVLMSHVKYVARSRPYFPLMTDLRVFSKKCFALNFLHVSQRSREVVLKNIKVFFKNVKRDQINHTESQAFTFHTNFTSNSA